MKGYLRIGGAFLLSAVVIAGALYLRSIQNTDEPGTIAVASAPQRNYIESLDSDSDGISDWEEELQKKVIESAAAPAPIVENESDGLTYTDQFARSFFEDFVEAKTPGAPPQNEEEFINAAVNSIEASTRSKIYTRADVTVTDSDGGTVRSYGNTIADVIIRHSIDKKDAGLILSRALEQNDPEMLNELAPIKDVYRASLEETLRVPVPDSLVTEHLNLLNTYQAMHDDIHAMEQAFYDPLYALARLKRYEEDAQGFYLAFANLSKAFRAAGVLYTTDEQGSLFLLFET